MRKDKGPDLDKMLTDARRYLANGRFFMALDLCGQIEWELNERPPDLQTEYRRKQLAPISTEAWSRTAQAVDEMLPRRHAKAA